MSLSSFDKTICTLIYLNVIVYFYLSHSLWEERDEDDASTLKS